MRDGRSLFALDPDAAHLNHGSFGATPISVLLAQDRVRREVEQNPHRYFSELYPERLRQARTVVASFVGADPSNLVLLRNVTDAINSAVASVPLEPGDEVLTTSHEYASNLVAWRNRCRDAGATLTVVDPFGGADPAERVLASHLSARTRILFVSHITSSAALRINVQPLLDEARRRDVLTIVDGAHGPGQVDLDLASVNADLYVGSLHKWAMFPRGSSFFVARESIHDLLRPQLVSWHYAAAGLPDRFSWQGTFDPSGWLVGQAVLDVHEQVQANSWDRHAHQLSLYAQDRLLKLPGVRPIGTSVDRARFMFAVSVPVEGEELRRRLRAANIWAWTGSIDDRTLLRVSTFLYNGEEDVDRLLREMELILAVRTSRA